VTGQRRVAAALALAVLLGGAEASADLSMTAQPILGIDGANQGWTSYAVRIESTEPAPVKGRVVLRGESHKGAAVSEAPVTLLPGAAVLVRLPVHASNAWSFQAELQDAGGKVLASQSLPTRNRGEPLLVDLHNPSRIAAALRGAKVPTSYIPERHRGASAHALAVGTAGVDATTGDPILPHRAAEWGAATAVLAPSGLLARLGGAEQEALAGYVLGGGTLAVVVERPEDLRQGFLPTLAGGILREAGAAEHLRRFPSEAPPERAGKMGSKTVTPAKEVAEALKAYGGGNVKPSDLGSSAPYGLGEIHLLPFDPSRAPEVDDPWVQSRMLDLVRHAWDRHAFVAMPLGAVQGKAGRDEVRKQLDPNESGRWSILAAVALLLLYAVGAGPVNFLLASRAGKPLRAPLLLPVLSAAAFFAVVGLALATKGVKGEARRFGLIEAAGGMSRGTIRRFRGFFTPVAQQVTVGASSEQGLPVLLSDESRPMALRVDRGGVELRDVPVLPWQTLVVSEEDVVPLQGGVALIHDQGDVRIVNRLGRDLRGLVVQVPGRGLHHLPSLADGATALASSGKLLSSLGLSTSMAGSLRIYPLSVGLFKGAVEQDSAGLEAAWTALGKVGNRSIDWWPEDQPVLLAQIDGGEGVREDQGLRVTRDRTLLRVVGYGGEP
jgi:hypothetical protein